MTDLTLFIGRFHPLVVHVPIGVLLLVGVVELIGRFRPNLRLPDGVRTVILIVAVVSTLLAAGCGWLLGRDGGYDEVILDRHRILGFVTLGLTVGLLVVRRWYQVYGVTLVSTLIVLMWTGHNGGSMTHGSGYLAEYAPPILRPLLGGGPPGRPAPESLARADVFHDVVQPVLNARCVACHGDTRIEGDLRLDSFAAIMAGGKHGDAVIAGDPAESLLLQRLYLPLDDKEHMPPAGRPQPTDADIAVLEWWIANEAPEQGSFLALAPDPEIVDVVATQLGLPPPALPDRATVVAAALVLERRLGITIRPLSADGPWLAATARLQGEEFGDTQLAELAEIAPALRHLDLGTTAVTNRGLQHLALMAELRRLRLDGTAITDDGLIELVSLKRLTSLNLHTTAITDAGVAQLVALQRLRQLYLWQTSATPAAVEALATKLENRRKLDRYRTQIATNQRLIATETFASDFGASLFETPTQEPESSDY